MSGDLNLFVSGALLRKRVSAGLSLEDLAKLTGISVERLSGFEVDSRGADLGSLQAIADAYGEDVTCFFSGYALARQGNRPETLDS